MNGIDEDKQVPVLLTMIGSTNYALLSNLVSPGKPKDKTFAQLAEVLCSHFDPKTVSHSGEVSLSQTGSGCWRKY